MTLLVCLLTDQELDETTLLQKQTEVLFMVNCLITVQPSVATFKFSFTTKEKLFNSTLTPNMYIT